LTAFSYPNAPCTGLPETKPYNIHPKPRTTSPCKTHLKRLAKGRCVPVVVITTSTNTHITHNSQYHPLPINASAKSFNLPANAKNQEGDMPENVLGKYTASPKMTNVAPSTAAPNLTQSLEALSTIYTHKLTAIISGQARTDDKNFFYTRADVFAIIGFSMLFSAIIFSPDRILLLGISMFCILVALLLELRSMFSASYLASICNNFLNKLRSCSHPSMIALKPIFLTRNRTAV